MKQRIKTIRAKAFIKYFPKENVDKSYGIYFMNKALCRLVIKQEEDMEDCPTFYQFYQEIKGRMKNAEEFVITNTTLTNRFIIMDFEDIFMPCSENAIESTRDKKNQLQQSVRDIIENGFDIYTEESDKPIHMVAFDKSGNMSRKSRISFVDEMYYEGLNKRLNLGMDFSKILVQESKYYAYRGLYLSSSIRIEHQDFEITPQTLVVLCDERKDPKNPNKPITGYNYDKVNYISAKIKEESTDTKDKVWEIEEQKEKEILYVDTPFDGVGFVVPSYADLMNEALGISNATSFQIRLPFAKGMLHQVDVHKFLDTENINRSVDYHVYTDAFGIKRDLGKARIFITESMFKAKKWIVDYLEKTNQADKDPMEFYCEMLKEYDHALYVSGTNLPYGHSKYVHLSYQTMNTLKFTEEQFNRILDRHKLFIKEPVTYLNSFDISEVDDSQDTDEGKIDYHIPNWRRALNENDKLSEDIYIKHELKNTRKGLLTKLATGKILVEGQTRYLCRDLLPLLVSMLENPQDWFPKYLYYRFYLPTDGTDTNAAELRLDFHSYYAFFRNPHLSRHEQYIMNRFCDADEETYKGKIAYKYYKKYKELYDLYFGHLTGIVMVPRHSALPLCLGGADFDGDLVSVVYNQDVVNAVASGAFEKQETKYFGEVYQRKLPVIIIPTTYSEKTKIKENVPYDHIKNTFSNRIGQISDAAIAIGQQEYGHSLSALEEKSSKQKEEKVQGEAVDKKLPSCAMCTILTGLEIDAAKNGEHPNLDAILEHSIEKASFIQFLHKFKKLRSDSEYSFDDLKVEAKTSKGNESIEVTAKNCKTKAKFEMPSAGTYINELPLAFCEAFQDYKKKDIVKTTKDTGVFPYTENKEKEEEKIRDLQSKCQGIFDYYFFYAKTLMHILSNEKNKGFFAYENLENKLYQIYDEEETVRLQREVVPKLLRHFKKYVSPKNLVSDMKDRMNQSQWLFVPMHKREAILEEIIGGGFSSGILDEEEKALLFNFHNRGYINLWLILSIIEGPKESTFEDIMSRDFKSPMKEENKNLELEKKLRDYLRSYYEDNSTETLGKIYAACLGKLGGILKQSEVSEQNKIAALYELTVSSLDNRRFFWDVFGWEKMEAVFL